VLSRLLVLVLTAATAQVRHHDALSLWNAWDSRWYLGIAVHGYGWAVHGKPAVAFFPLYPLLVHLLWLVRVPATIAGLVISNVAFLGVLFYIYALARSEWGERSAAFSIGIICFFPTALFTFAPYSESLFLLCAAGALFHARRCEALPAGIWAALAMATHLTGLILLPAIAIAAAGTRPIRWAMLVGPTFLVAAGYAIYLRLESIPWSMLANAQRAWHRGVTFPWTGFGASLHWLIFHGLSNPAWALENLLGLGVVVGFLWLTVASARYVSPPVVVYCSAFWLIVLCTPEWQDGYYAPFSSVDRFVLALFPLGGWVALKLRGLSEIRIEAALAVLFALATCVYLAGGWVG
jgi:Gpi18-like mannosyltransferase